MDSRHTHRLSAEGDNVESPLLIRSTDMWTAPPPSPRPAPLLSDPPDRSPGFSPRGIHRMLLQSPPYSQAKLELLRRLRTPLKAERPPSHTLGYLTWLQVSRLPPLFPLRSDRLYDSAVWRRVTAAPAGPGPPEPIPAPSRMEGNTWSKFAGCSGVRRDEGGACALRIRSQGRAPPRDSHGNIHPPPGYRRKSPPLAAGSVTDMNQAGPAPEEPPGLFPSPECRDTPRKLSPPCNSPTCGQIPRRHQELQRGGARTAVPDNNRMNMPGAPGRVA